MRRRFGYLCAATAVAMLIGAAPAGAWWAEVTAYRMGTLGAAQVHAVPGEAIDLVAVGEPGAGIPDPFTPGRPDSVLLRDESNPVTPPPAGHGNHCTQLDTHSIRCQRPAGPYSDGRIHFLELALGAGDDRVEVPRTSLPLVIMGGTGDGNDTIEARSLATMVIYAGEGDDRITVRGHLWGGLWGTDGIYGGPGDDVIDVVNGSKGEGGLPGYLTCDEGNDILYADEGEAGSDCEQTIYPGPLRRLE